LARVEQGADVAGVTGQYLIPGTGHQSDQRVYDVRTTGVAQHLPGRLGVREIDAEHVDHRESTGESGLPGTVAPGLSDHGSDITHVVYTWPTWYAHDMSEMPSESVRDVRSHLADVVDRADRDDQATVITRRGKPVAAVVPIEVLRKYQEWEEREINRIVDERMSSRSAAIPMEDVIQETLARNG